MKVTSFWYKEGDGQKFHGENKARILMSVLNGNYPFEMLKTLTIKREWLDTTNEVLLPSQQMMVHLHADYVREMGKLLKGCGWLNKLAVKKLADFLLILFKTDDMYYERMGYLIWRFIQIAPAWAAADHAGRKYLLHLERLNYFTHEHRLDRIQHLTFGWDYLEARYADDVGVQRSVDWLVDWLGKHAAEFNYDEVGRLGMTSFHPENWYPVGRGGLWDAVHGGCG